MKWFCFCKDYSQHFWMRFRGGELFGIFVRRVERGDAQRGCCVSRGIYSSHGGGVHRVKTRARTIKGGCVRFM